MEQLEQPEQTEQSSNIPLSVLEAWKVLEQCIFTDASDTNELVQLATRQFSQLVSWMVTRVSDAIKAKSDAEAAEQGQLDYNGEPATDNADEYEVIDNTEQAYTPPAITNEDSNE